MQTVSQDLASLGLGNWFPPLPPTSICRVEGSLGLGGLFTTVLNPAFKSVSWVQSRKTIYWVPPCSGAPAGNKLLPLFLAFRRKDGSPLELLPPHVWWSRQRGCEGPAHTGLHLWTVCLLFLLCSFTANKKNSKGWSSHPHPTPTLIKWLKKECKRMKPWEGDTRSWPILPHLRINTLI